MKKHLKKLLDALIDHQSTLFEQGHTFWDCSAQDVDHNKPFYYYQINKSKSMSTCTTCYKLIELRKQIRQVEKLLNQPQTPLYTNFKQENCLKRISVKNKSEWNPNYAYMS